MQSWKKAALGAMALAIGIVLWWRVEPERARPTVGPASSSPVEVGAADRTPATPSRRARRSAQRVEPHQSHGADEAESVAKLRDVGRSLRVRCIDSSGAVVAGLAVRVAGPDGSVVRVSSEDGDFELRIPQEDAGPWLVLPVDWLGPIRSFPVVSAQDFVRGQRRVTLVLPPHGAVHVKIQGLAEAGADRHSLLRVSSEEHVQSMVSRKLLVGQDLQTEHRIERVALGQRLRVRLREVPGLSMEAERFSGPRVASEVIEKTLAVSATRRPIVRVTVRDKDGQLLANQDVTVYLTREERGTYPLRGRTDRQGVVEVTVMRIGAEVGWGQLERCRVVWQPGSLAESLPGQFADVLVDAPLEGLVDLGSLRLAEAGPLATGVVVDEGGQPVEGALIGLVLARHPGVFLGDNLIVRAGSAGRFVFPGPLDAQVTPADGLRLRAELRGRAVAFSDFEESGREHRIVLPEAGGLAIRFAVATPIRGSVSVTPVHESLGARRSQSAQIRPGERVEWLALPSGNYDLEIRLDGTRKPLAVVRDVVVVEGSHVRDERLDPLSLDGLLRLVNVRVRRPDGSGALEAGVARCSSGHMKSYPIDAAGNCLLVLPAGSDRFGILVISPHGRSVWIPNAVDADYDVLLQPEQLVRLRVAGLPDGHELEPSHLVCVEPQVPFRLLSASAVGPRIESANSMVVSLPPAGAFELKLLGTNYRGVLNVPEQFSGEELVLTVTDSR